MFYNRAGRIGVFQVFMFGLGAGVVFYATCVLFHVSASYQLGIRSMLTPNVIGEPTNAKGLVAASGDLILVVGDIPVHTWADLLDAPDELHEKIEKIEAGEASPYWY